jgi:hypothetical protein
MVSPMVFLTKLDFKKFEKELPRILNFLGTHAVRREAYFFTASCTFPTLTELPSFFLAKVTKFLPVLWIQIRMDPHGSAFIQK